MDHQETEGQGQKIFQKAEEIPKGSDGWLSPTGRFFRCSTVEHDECAEFLIKNDPEEILEKADQWERKWVLEKPPRFGLKDLGFVLVRGDTLHTEDAANYTREQLAALNEAGIRIVSALDTSVEFDSEEILNAANKISDRVSSSAVAEKLRDRLARRVGRDNVEKIEMGEIDVTLRALNELDKERRIGTRERAQEVQSLGKFKKGPLKARIVAKEWSQNGEETEFKNGVWDLLSQGYVDELYFHGRHATTYRAIQFPSFVLVAIFWEYHHDVSEIQPWGEHEMALRVVDPHKFKEMIRKYTDGKEEGKDYRFGNPDGYFANLIKT